MRFADRLVGKGLDTFIIVQLIVYNLAWMVVLVVPMAVLVATLMAFGTMSQNNEVTIMKSSGISLYKMMMAPLIAGAVIGYLLISFNNDVLPDANHEAKILMQDITNKKPTLSLEPGVFSQEVPNYAMLAREINQKNNELSDLVIYDYSNPAKVNVVTAQKGKLYFSKDQTKLIMDLQNGEIHESESGGTVLYRKLIFNKHRIAMNAEQFSFQQSGPGGQRGDRELSSQDMLIIIDSLKREYNSEYKLLTNEINKYMFIDSANNKMPVIVNNETAVPGAIYSRAIAKVTGTKNIISSNNNRLIIKEEEMDRFWVEVHKKYSIPAACIVFVLIGAPLGVMTRKGGFGVAAGISLFFFLIYWAFLIGGEKLADRNIVSPFIGMWAANIVLGAAGIILTIRTAKETVTLTLDFSFMIKLLKLRGSTFQADEEQA
jgi:lipopolysaccharide export system permease protein